MAGVSGIFLVGEVLLMLAAVPVVTAEQLQPVVDAITANLGVLLPVGLTILGIMVGVALIPRIIYKFF